MKKHLFILLLLLTASAQKIQAGLDSCKIKMDSAHFAVLHNQIKVQDFDGVKITMLSEALKSSCLSTDQVRRAILLFSFEEDKVLMTKRAYGKIADPHNFIRIYAVFEFESSKLEIKQHIDGLLKTN